MDWGRGRPAVPSPQRGAVLARRPARIPMKPVTHAPARDPSSGIAESAGAASWQRTLYVVIFEADTRAGKAFDVALLIAILTSVVLVMLETVHDLARDHESFFRIGEWVVTGLFTIEYVLRLACLKRPLRYALSFFGIIDLLAILPGWYDLMLLGGKARPLLVVRSFRLLRIFRIFRLTDFLDEASVLRHAIWSSRAKIVVFLTTVMVIVVVLGTMLYLVESEQSGFTSIPQSVYWAIVTLTTVGYGDVTPVTPAGKALAALLMIAGYSLIIVPTGILSAEFARSSSMGSPQACPGCSRSGHDAGARHCKFCGARLPG